MCGVYFVYFRGAVLGVDSDRAISLDSVTQGTQAVLAVQSEHGGERKSFSHRPCFAVVPFYRIVSTFLEMVEVSEFSTIHVWFFISSGNPTRDLGERPLQATSDEGMTSELHCAIPGKSKEPNDRPASEGCDLWMELYPLPPSARNTFSEHLLILSPHLLLLLSPISLPYLLSLSLLSLKEDSP